MEKVEVKEFLENSFKDLKSMSVTENGDGEIVVNVKRYKGNGGCASAAQLEYIMDLYNYQSASNLRKLNKWAASALITAGKRLEAMGVTVTVECPR